MDYADLEVVDLDNLGFWQASNLVAITLDNVSLALRGSQVLQPLNSLS